MADGSSTQNGPKPRSVWLLVVQSIFVGLVISALISAGVSVAGEGMPQSAILYANDLAHRYASPPCIDDAIRDSNPLYAGYTRQTTYGELLSRRQERWAGEAECRENGGLANERADRSLARYLAERAGFMRPPTSRWESDGSWRW
jgi:hypothetical protein